MIQKGFKWAIYIFPGSAYIDLIVKYGWDAITILYENNDSMMRLKAIFDRTAEVETFHTLKIGTKKVNRNAI